MDKLTEDQQKVLYSILGMENKIFSHTHRGQADYILLANKAGQLWSKMEVAFEPRFRKVQVIRDPILDWDILGCKVGTNLHMVKTGVRDESNGVEEITLQFEKEREEDYVLSEYIFDPLKMEKL